MTSLEKILTFVVAAGATAIIIAGKTEDDPQEAPPTEKPKADNQQNEGNEKPTKQAKPVKTKAK